MARRIPLELLLSVALVALTIPLPTAESMKTPNVTDSHSRCSACPHSHPPVPKLCCTDEVECAPEGCAENLETRT